MAAKPDLRLAVNNAAGKRETKPQAEPTEAAGPSTPNAHYRPSREGKAAVTGYFPRAVRKQMRTMAADQDTTIEDLIAEALNDLFAKYQRPEIAPRKERTA